jgi:hypothetical protein
MKSQMEYPSKMYPTKSGKLLTSEQMAEMQEIGINKINEQLKETTNPRKIKTLKNRLREIKLWLLVHPDVAQYLKK